MHEDQHGLDLILERAELVDTLITFLGTESQQEYHQFWFDYGDLNIVLPNNTTNIGTGGLSALRSRELSEQWNF